MRLKTQLLASSITLSGTYANYALDLSSLGSLGVNKRNAVAFHFILSQGGGDTLTFSPQELFSYLSSGSEQIGWCDVQKDNGTGTMTATELVTTLASSSFSMSTFASNVRIRVKGTGTLTIYATVAQAE